MTTPTDIHRLLHRIANSVNIAEARLEHATEALRRQTADGYATTASGRDAGPRGTNELQPTETAANTNLGDIYGYHDNTRDADPDIDTHQTGYHPGPTTRLADIEDNLRAALKSLDQAHTTIGDCGIPPLLTRRYQCPGINGQGCQDWQDTDPGTGQPRRADHLCIDCGRAADSNRRRLRKHRAAS